MGSPLIYFDFAATSFVSDPVKLEMEKAISADWGNASGLHQAAQKSAAALSKARRVVAQILAVKPAQIIFTSGGSEANNLSLKGQVISWNQSGLIPHIISSKLEHASITKSLEQLESLGWAAVDWVDCNSDGAPNLESIKAKITDQTKLACFMAISNETGAIFPIKEIAALLKPKNIKLHIDAVQGALTENLAELSSFTDTLSLSSHKLYGPKGIGLLYKSNSVDLTPLITGGAQEDAMRAGTENIPGVLGFTKALELAQGELEANRAHFQSLKDHFVSAVESIAPEAKILCKAEIAKETGGAMHIVSVLFLPHDANRLLRKLDLKGFQLASGSACSTGNPEPSPSILAMGFSADEARSLVRTSFGLSTTTEEIDLLITAFKEVLHG